MSQLRQNNLGRVRPAFSAPRLAVLACAATLAMVGASAHAQNYQLRVLVRTLCVDPQEGVSCKGGGVTTNSTNGGGSTANTGGGLSANSLDPEPSGGASGVEFSTTQVAFGYTTVNTSKTKTVTLTNGGSSPFTLNLPSLSAPFDVGSNCPTSLPAGSSCTLSFYFSPTVTGDASTSFKIDGLPTLSLTGRGAFAAAGGTVTTFANSNLLSSDYSWYGITPLAQPTYSVGECYDSNGSAGCTQTPRNYLVTPGAAGYSPLNGSQSIATFPVSSTRAIRFSGTNLLLLNMTTSSISTAQTVSMGAVPGVRLHARDPYSDFHYVVFNPTVVGQPTIGRFRQTGSNNITDFVAYGSWDGTTMLAGSSIGASAVSPDGHLYFSTSTGNVGRLNVTTGAYSAVPALSLPSGYSHYLATSLRNDPQGTGIAFDGHGNALRMANCQVLKYPLQDGGTFGTPSAIAGAYNTCGIVNGTGSNARVGGGASLLRQGPNGTAWLVHFSTTTGGAAGIRQLK